MLDTSRVGWLLELMLAETLVACPRFRRTSFAGTDAISLERPEHRNMILQPERLTATHPRSGAAARSPAPGPTRGPPAGAGAGQRPGRRGRCPTPTLR